MKKVKVCIFLLLIFILQSLNVFAAQLNSANYKQNVIVSSGGENSSSSSYKTNIAVGIINGIISSASYINSLGFFHTLLLADGQPCASASQCEGGFCCSSSCSSSTCPTGGAAGGGGAAPLATSGAGQSNLTVKQIKDFSVTPSSIKEHIVLGSAKTDKIIIKNTGNTALSFALNVATVNDFVFLSENSFSLEPGEEKTVEANIIGKILGSYLGEMSISAGGITKSVSLVIEVESEQVLFDVKMDIPSAYKEVEAGKELKAQITLFNIGPARKVDVTPTYIVKDKRGNVIYEASETFAVEKQKSYAKSIKLPANLQPDDYLAIVELRYENSFAVSSELFKVIPKQEIAIQKTLKSNTIIISILIVFAGLMFLFAYLLIPKLKIARTKLEKFHNVINDAKEALDKNDIAKAKQLFIEVMRLYDGLEAKEKKEVYGELMEFYAKLK